MQPSVLQGILGHAIGQKLGFLASNIDPRRLEVVRRAKSMGAQSALGRRIATDELLRTQLGFLADRIATRLARQGPRRAHDHRAGPVPGPGVDHPVAHPPHRDLDDPHADRAQRRAGQERARRPPRRTRDHLLAISVSNLVPECPLQLELPLAVDDVGEERHRAGSPQGSARWALDRAMDRVRERFGREAVGHAGVVFRDDDGVPRRVPRARRVPRLTRQRPASVRFGSLWGPIRTNAGKGGGARGSWCRVGRGASGGSTG